MVLEGSDWTMTIVTEFKEKVSNLAAFLSHSQKKPSPNEGEGPGRSQNHFENKPHQDAINSLSDSSGSSRAGGGVRRS